MTFQIVGHLQSVMPLITPLLHYVSLKGDPTRHREKAWIEGVGQHAFTVAHPTSLHTAVCPLVILRATIHFDFIFGQHISSILQLWLDAQPGTILNLGGSRQICFRDNISNEDRLRQIFSLINWR